VVKLHFPALQNMFLSLAHISDRNASYRTSVQEGH